VNQDKILIALTDDEQQYQELAKLLNGSGFWVRKDVRYRLVRQSATTQKYRAIVVPMWTRRHKIDTASFLLWRKNMPVRSWLHQRGLPVLSDSSRQFKNTPVIVINNLPPDVQILTGLSTTDVSVIINKISSTPSVVAIVKPEPESFALALQKI